jgi:hypothetical protein
MVAKKTNERKRNVTGLNTPKIPNRTYHFLFLSSLEEKNNKINESRIIPNDKETIIFS